MWTFLFVVKLFFGEGEAVRVDKIVEQTREVLVVGTVIANVGEHLC